MRSALWQRQCLGVRVAQEPGDTNTGLVTWQLKQKVPINCSALDRSSSEIIFRGFWFIFLVTCLSGDSVLKCFFVLFFLHNHQPFIHLLLLYREAGNKGNSLSRDTQTFLAPVPSACPSWAWMSRTSNHVGVQEASQKSSCPQASPNHPTEESHFATDPPLNLMFHLSLTI